MTWDRNGVTTLSAVPSQLHLLAREILALHGAEAAAAGVAPCSSLLRVLSGGEALTTAMAADLAAALPRCQLYNTYGPTETTVGAHTDGSLAVGSAQCLSLSLHSLCASVKV